jgi:hypothetical protein
MPSLTAESEPSPIGGKGIFSLGVYTETFAPIKSSTFSSSTAGSQSMRYQVPVSLGAEVSYGFSERYEAALTAGYERFETQQFTGLDTLNNKRFDILQYSGFPVMGIFRMRWNKTHWAPEMEAGAGALIGKIKTRSTQLNSTELEKKGPFIKGHISAGSGFEWGEAYTLHLHLGYSLTNLGDQVYKTASYSLSQSKFHHGVFFRALLRYQF